MPESDKYRSLLVILPLAISFSLFLGILAGLFVFRDDQNMGIRKKPGLKKVNEVVNLIDKEYVDEVKVEKLTESAIVSMLEKLDPHSTFIPAEQKELSEISFESNYEGIGIEFNILRDTLVVISPISGGPSEKLGIQPGDKIIKIDGNKVAGIGLDNQQVFDLLRGEKGTKVSVEVLREGNKKLIEFNVLRDKIPNESIDGAFMVNDEIAFVKINRFTQTTDTEFRNRLEELKKKGMKKLILDLRNNSGGVLSSALFVADELIENDKLILYTKSKSPENIFEFRSRIEGEFEKGPLIVLINEGSASASEIVAGAIQDHDRGMVLGRRSFGKGLVQGSFDLSDGSELRLTISKYFIPSGRSIQKPYNENNEAYFEDISRRYEHGEFFHSDSIHFPDSLIFRTASGRKVFGGGGIMPDIFVASDTTFRSDYLLELNSKGLIYEYSFEYANQNRDRLENMGLDTYVDDFDLREEMLKQLIQKGENQGIDYNDADFKKSKKMIEVQSKALIARHVWGDNGFFKVYNSIDPAIQVAIERLKEPSLSFGKK